MDLMSAAPPKFATPVARIGPRVTGAPRTAMETAPADAIVLRGGDVWSNDGLRNALVVQCLAGAAWLTRAGDGEDVILTPGDIHLTCRRGKVVVQPLSEQVVLRVIR